MVKASLAPNNAKTECTSENYKLCHADISEDSDVPAFPHFFGDFFLSFGDFGEPFGEPPPPPPPPAIVGSAAAAIHCPTALKWSSAVWNVGSFKSLNSSWKTFLAVSNIMSP